MLDFLNIYKGLIDPGLQQALLPVKVVVIIVSVIMLVAAIWFLANTNYLNNLWLDDIKDYKTWKKRYSPRAKKRNYKSKQNIAPFGVAGQVEQKEQPVKREIKQTVPRTDWERIIDKLESGRALNYNLALLDADKLLQKKLDGRDLDNFYAQKVMEAKELVEEVMSDDSRDITLEEVGEAIDIYKKALESLD